MLLHHRLTLTLLLNILISFTFSAQLDSLKSMKEGEQVDYLLRKYLSEGDNLFYEEGISIIESHKGGLYLYEKSLFLAHKAFSFYDQSIDSVQFYLNKVDIKQEPDTEIKLTHECNRALGLAYIFDGKYTESMEYFNKNILLCKQVKDYDKLIASYSDAALPHYYSEGYDEAINQWKNALNTAEDLKNYNSSYSQSLNIAMAYSQWGEIDSAKKYKERSLEYSKNEGVDVDHSTLYLNLGVIEYNNKDFEAAIEMFTLSSQKALLTKNQKVYAKAISNVSSCFLELGKSDLSIGFLKEALYEVKTKQEPNFVFEMMQLLGTSYAETGEYELGYHYLDSAFKMKDSLINEARTQQISELKEKYESVAKDQLIAEKEYAFNLEKSEKEKEKAAREKEQSIKFLFILGFILMSTIAFFIFRSYRNKRNTAEILEEQNAIIEEKNKDITDSIQYAKNLQESILPKSNIIAQTIPNYMVFFRPRDIVSGDFYWHGESAQYTYLAAADCTGHGVPGAFVSMMCYNLLNTALKEKKKVLPGDILTEVNRSLITEFRNDYSKFQSNDGMDIVLVAIDKVTKEVSFSGAMNSLVQIRNEEVIEHKGNRFAIGGSSVGCEFDTISVNTNKGDVFYFYSDGYSDQFGGPKGKKFMRKKLNELLSQIKEFKAEKQIDILLETLETWRGDLEQVDDILIVGFEVT